MCLPQRLQKRNVARKPLNEHINKTSGVSNGVPGTIAAKAPSKTHHYFSTQNTYVPGAKAVMKFEIFSCALVSQTSVGAVCTSYTEITGPNKNEGSFGR